MKKIPVLLGFIAVLMLPLMASATQLVDGAAACIGKKYLEKYERLVEADKALFTEDMLKRAQCYVNKRAVEVLVLNEIDTHVQIELLDGQRVWTSRDNLAEIAEIKAE